MGVDSLTICLEGNQGNVYHAGQEVKGAVTIVVSGDGVKYKKIWAKFHGDSEVEWTESKSGAGDNESMSTKHYRSLETYVNKSLELHPSGFSQEEPSHELPKGSHVLPFSFRLPEDIPASFEGLYGKVQYFVKVYIERPMAYDKTAKHFITVTSQVGPEKKPHLAAPSSQDFSNNFYTVSMKRSKLVGKVTLNKTAFVPGEVALVDIEIDNSNSQVDIQEIGLALRQRITYKADGTKKFVDHTLQECSFGENVKEGQVKNVRRELRIPHAGPTLEHCGNINVDYIIKVKLTPEGLHRSFSLEQTVVIGSTFGKSYGALLAAGGIEGAAIQ